MKQITASEAQAKAIESKKQKQKLSNKLIETINQRINEACYRGQFKCSLNSIDDSGNTIRGIGMYLSKNILDGIDEYFKQFGFKLEITKLKVGISMSESAHLIWNLNQPGDE